MSNASLKEQLLAVASQMTSTEIKPPVAAPRVPNAAAKSRPKPTTKSKPQKPKWLVFAQYGVELLKTYFPNCFKTIHEIKPLKIGIKQDLIKCLSTMDTVVTDDKACMVKSLAYYVNTLAYHRTVIEGAMRVDLEGNPAGVVSAAEAKYSSDKQQARLQAKQSASTRPQLQSKDVPAI